MRANTTAALCFIAIIVIVVVAIIGPIAMEVRESFTETAAAFCRVGVGSCTE